MKKLSKKQKNSKNLIVWWLMFIGAILLLLWFFSNKSLYTPNKDYVKNNIENIINQVAADDAAPVYKDIVDKGCTESDIGWLSSSYTCTFEANVYFLGSDSASIDFDRIKHALEDKGFRVANSETSLEKSITVRYEPHENTTIYFKIFRPNDRETAREYLQIDTDIPVASDEYIYGINVQTPYWSCSSGALWEGRCPAPPRPIVPSPF